MPPDERPYRILLTGTYCSLNRGDAAMQIVCATGLQHRLPGARVAIHAPLPDIDGPYYAARGIPVVRSTRRRLILGTLQWARMAVERGGAVGSDYPPADERAAIAGADMVVDLSGDMLTEDYGVHVAYSHYLPLLQAISAGTPVVICGQSVGPFRHTRALARHIISRAALVTLREQRSLDHVRTLEATPRRLEVTADLSFALRPASEADVDSALGRAGAGAGSWIGVSLSSLVERHRRSAGAQGTLEQELAAALRAVADSSGMRVLLVPHVYGPRRSQDDRVVLRRLSQSLGERAVVIDEQLDVEVLKGVIARCHVFVGARMHSVMAALSTGVPVIALAYSHKAAGIMNEFAMSEWVIDAALAERNVLTERLQALIAQRTPLASRIARQAVLCHDAANRNIDLIASILTGREPQ